MTRRNIVAIDLGASSGRVMLASWDAAQRQLALREVRRFKNKRQRRAGYDCWDLTMLEQEIRAGLAQLDEEKIVARQYPVSTPGALIWCCLMQRASRWVRRSATAMRAPNGLMEQAQHELSRSAIYARTGIQFLPFNTLYQMRALHQQQPDWQARVAHALMMPDYLHYRLTGNLNWEYTNATTTQMLNIHSGEWDRDLLAWAGVAPEWFGQPQAPGNTVGHWVNSAGVPVPVIAVATHDTASAVLATPLMQDDAALS
ncbi:Rhamnulokinase [Pantoea agglomerans]|uniref:Rhamnulokinase n=1 Tax=Enterobacter agglomerans TaxID=549 RepID=A0A379AFP8_ENTAG|nr:Rhamnulokinase [Pantoea agglomerans]